MHRQSSTTSGRTSLTAAEQDSLITARPPWRQGTGLQRLVNQTYLALARAAAARLARCELVRSVFVRRSLASGEPSFPLSDIDLTVVFHHAAARPGEVKPLLDTHAALRSIRRVLPIAGQVETLTVAEYPDWARLEPCREFSNSRTGILVAGEPFRIPECTVATDDAARRFCFWMETYIPRTINAASRRNLWKFAVEMWGLSAVARGLVPEMFLSRRDAHAAWKRHPSAGSGEPPPPGRGDSASKLITTLFEVASGLHARLRQPLQELTTPIITPLVVPPSLATRRLVVLPTHDAASSLNYRYADGIYLTPEALDLYITWHNPFLYDMLPQSVRDLGLARPPLASYLHTLERWSCGILARKPGFGLPQFGVGPRTIACARFAAKALASGQYIKTIEPEDLGTYGRTDHEFPHYFNQLYPDVYSMCGEVRRLVASIPATL